MRGLNLGLALASSAVAVGLIVLISGIDSPPTSSTVVEPTSSIVVEPTLGEATEMRLPPSIRAEPSESTETLELLSSDDSQERMQANQDQRPTATVFSRNGGIADEETTREQMKKMATNRIRYDYSLLLDELDLTPQQREALFALLVEDSIASTSTPHWDGETIDKEEQSSRVAAIIGGDKLQQFRELESNRGAYSKVQKIGSMVQKNGVPLTDTQRSGLIKLAIETRNKYLSSPPANVDRKSIEFLERALTAIAEYERHFMELAPSVLSAKQLVYLDKQYHYSATSRANALQQQRQELADGTRTEDQPLWYPLGEVE